MGHTINICKEHGRPQITCWDCKDAEITTLRARIAELEREKKALRGTLSINAPEALKALDQVFESPELLEAFTHAMKPTT